MFKKTIQAIILGAVYMATALQSANANANETEVKQQLTKKFPNLEVSNLEKVKDEGVKGLYSFVVNGRVVYTDETVSFIFTNGNLLSAKTADNLTLIHQQSANKVLFSRLKKESKDRAFKMVYGKGENEIISIEDADCPACKVFSKSLQFYKNPEKLNLTVYVFPFALSRIHPDAIRKDKLIWCSAKTQEGRSEVWKKWMAEGDINSIPASKSSECKDPIDQNIKEFTAIGINATPTVIFQDGSAAPGAIDPDQLIKALGTLKK